MANEKRLIDATGWDSFYADMGDSRNTMDSYDRGFIDALDRADDWMDAQTTVDAVEVVHGRWISVEDRLPEVGQCVLVWCESRMFKKHITISTYMRTYSAERETYFSRRVRNVTHWMPLPQPPKGE